ncbi:hypothetical protein J6590_075588 [Homalodisca vitripennis]|nr:hypothetical protein J6590_075588 [Homalodisca vitripennis]
MAGGSHVRHIAGMTSQLLSRRVSVTAVCKPGASRSPGPMTLQPESSGIYTTTWRRGSCPFSQQADYRHAAPSPRLALSARY